MLHRIHYIVISSLTFVALIVALTACVFGITSVALAPSSRAADQHQESTASAFKFERYDSGDEMLSALQLLFPQGTPKTRVDEVLVNGAKAAKIQDSEFPDTYSYFRSTASEFGSDGKRLRNRVWNISVIYKPDDTVDQLWVTDQQCSGGRPSNTEALLDMARANAPDFKEQLLKSFSLGVTKCWADGPERGSRASQSKPHADPSHQLEINKQQ